MTVPSELRRDADPLLELWLATRDAQSALEYLRAMQAYYLYVDPKSWDGKMVGEAADELENLMVGKPQS